MRLNKIMGRVYQGARHSWHEPLVLTPLPGRSPEGVSAVVVRNYIHQRGLVVPRVRFRGHASENRIVMRENKVVMHI